MHIYLTSPALAETKILFCISDLFTVLVQYLVLCQCHDTILDHHSSLIFLIPITPINLGFLLGILVCLSVKG